MRRCACTTWTASTPCETRRCYTCRGSFPEYTQEARGTVDERRLQLGVWRATAHFTEHHEEYQRVFRQYASRKYSCKPSAVKFVPLASSLRRLRRAVLVGGDDCYGWTNGYRIHISRDLPMAFDELVGTLLHEELHCFCRVRGRFLGADADHHCMRVLGEQC